MPHDEIARVLAGQASYDALDDRGQAFVRVAWNQQSEDRIAALDLTEPLRAAGRPRAEADADADADGNVVVREPGSAAGS